MMDKRSDFWYGALACLTVFGFMAAIANSLNEDAPVQNYVRPLPNHEWFVSQRQTHEMLVRHRLTDQDSLRCKRIAAEYNKYAARVHPTAIDRLPNYLSEEAC